MQDDTKSFQASTRGLINGIDKVTQGWEPWFKAAARCQLEAMSLASRRAQAYMELPARIGACHAPQDIVGEQVKFWQTAAKHYVDAWGRIADGCRELRPVPWGFWDFLQAAGPSKEPEEKQERDYIAVRETDDERRKTRSSEGSRRAA